MKLLRTGIVALTACAALGACQSDTLTSVNRPSRPGDNSALSTMERVAVAAQGCWFGGKDPAFKATRMSPELSSHSGKPRILVVPVKNLGGLPVLVVEAVGNPAKLSAFGPMLEGPDGARIGADVRRWAARNAACAAAG